MEKRPVRPDPPVRLTFQIRPLLASPYLFSGARVNLLADLFSG
jgi:hypothetical protein